MKGRLTVWGAAFKLEKDVLNLHMPYKFPKITQK